MKPIVFILLFFTTLIIQSCYDMFSSCIYGDNNLLSEERIITNFEGIESSGSFFVNVIKSPTQRVIINADENILRFIKTDVSNGILEIGVKNHCCIKNTSNITVYVYTNCLNYIKLSGSGNIQCDHFITNNFTTNIKGSGTIKISIEAETLYSNVSGSGDLFISGSIRDGIVNINGSGNVNSLDLFQINCNATISGSGNIYVNVENFINAKISGSGNIYYLGHPLINSSINGSGTVKPY